MRASPLDLAKRHYAVRTAHEAVQVAKDLGRQSAIQRLVRMTQDATIGKLLTPEQQAAANQPDDMQLHVGDSITAHIPTPATQRGGGLAQLALAGLLGAAIPSAAGAYLLANYLATRQPPAVEAPDYTDTDTDTRYQLTLPDGKPIAP